MNYIGEVKPYMESIKDVFMRIGMGIQIAPDREEQSSTWTHKDYF